MDYIVQSSDPPESKVIVQDNVLVKYPLIDQGRDLRGEEVRLQLMYDAVPLTGPLYSREQNMDSTSRFTLPLNYR